MTEDCSLPSMGSTYNILLPCSDFHSRLGTPSHSYSGCGNGIMCRGTDCKQGAEPWQAGPAAKPAGVKLICKTTSSWWLWVRNYSYSEFCHRFSPHPSARHFTSLCYSFSFLGDANTAKSIFISHSPPPFASEQVKGYGLLGRNNWRKTEEARYDQRVKPFLTHLRQQVLRGQILISASDSQLMTEQLLENAQIANNSSHNHPGTNV